VDNLKQKMNKLRYCLIIDDDLDDQEIFLMCMNSISKDLDCRTANNGVEAIAMLESQIEYVPDYIFLDVNMPKMGGMECLTQIKKIDRLRSTKVFMYSTTSESSMIEESRALGADDIIIKPAQTIVLKEILSKILRIPSK